MDHLGEGPQPLLKSLSCARTTAGAAFVAAEEGAAFGAAILAGVGAGLWPGIDGACDQGVHSLENISCQPDVVKLMNERYCEYQPLYPALLGLYVTHDKFYD